MCRSSVSRWGLKETEKARERSNGWRSPSSTSGEKVNTDGKFKQNIIKEKTLVILHLVKWEPKKGRDTLHCFANLQVKFIFPDICHISKGTQLSKLWLTYENVMASVITQMLDFKQAWVEEDGMETQRLGAELVWAEEKHRSRVTTVFAQS